VNDYLENNNGMSANSIMKCRLNRVVRAFCFCAALIVLAHLARAEGVLTPYAAEDIEHNTNLFYLPSGDPAPAGKHGTSFGDTFFEERAGLDGTYFLDQQKFFGTAEFRRFDYDNFTYLSHNEELFDGGLKWKLNQAFDGQIEYKHEQRMVEFQELNQSTVLILETENTGTALFNIYVTPQWRLETLAKDHLLDSPRADIPGLSLHEDSIQQGLKYLGVSNLAAGVEAEYLDGKYNHDPSALNPDYHQISGSLAATYEISGLTHFNGTVGFTRREDPTTSGLSGITGTLGYQHAITPKTSFTLQLNRALATYVTTGGNEIDTSAAALINWQATYKILVKAGYSYTDSKFPEAPEAGGSADRIDHFQTANVELTYQVLHWLSIRPYARYQTRHSSQSIYTFNGNIVGVELLFKKLRPNR